MYSLSEYIYSLSMYILCSLNVHTRVSGSQSHNISQDLRYFTTLLVNILQYLLYFTTLLDNPPTGLKIDLPAPAKFSHYALPESAINPEAKPKIFGAKSMNIVHSRRTLPEWIQTPRSAVVPFGVFEKVMEHADNSVSRQ